MNEETATEDAIYSSLAEDPCLSELVEMYVAETPERVSALEANLNDRNWSELQRLTHQIKASGPGYGFEVIGATAAAAEQSMLTNQAGEQTIQKITQLIDELRRIRVK